jgi:hypothetical protein
MRQTRVGWLSEPLQRGGGIISGGDLEACEPIGQIGNANFRPLPPYGIRDAMG